MGQVKSYPPVKLIAGLIVQAETFFEQAEEKLRAKFGEIDLFSQVMPFDYTSYYAAEMGENLKRKFISFQRLIRPEDLSDIKLTTNLIEEQLALPLDKKRRVNIDPGYVSASKMVLASTKDHSHRLYLNKGIFAEITLKFANKTFQPWEWTYPDYKAEAYIEVFNRIRKIYMSQLKEMGISAHPL